MDPVQKKYSGFGDPLLTFPEGSRSFADLAGNVAGAGDIYSVEITNTATSAEDKVIALIPAFFSTAAQITTHTGRTCDAILADGEIIDTSNKEVNASGTPKSILSFLQFIKHNPTIILGAKMRVDDQEQLDEAFYMTKVRPTGNNQDKSIYPSNFKNSNQNNEKLAEVPFNGVQFDNQTVLLLKVRDGRTVKIDFFLGASLNTAAALARKQNAALSGRTASYQ